MNNMDINFIQMLVQEMILFQVPKYNISTYKSTFFMQYKTINDKKIKTIIIELI